MLVTGYWLLVAGYWLLVTGCWYYTKRLSFGKLFKHYFSNRIDPHSPSGANIRKLQIEEGGIKKPRFRRAVIRTFSVGPMGSYKIGC